jgi:hypothetical protein
MTDPKTKTRRYVVLSQRQLAGTTPDSPTTEAWAIVGAPVEAANDQAAIKLACADLLIKAGVFVAVPARSFRPRTRTVETVEKDKWS